MTCFTTWLSLPPWASASARPIFAVVYRSDAGLKRMKQNRDCVRISSTNTVSISAKARLTGYITSFVVCAVNTFGEEGVIKLDEMNE